MVRVSVIITTYNSERMLLRTLDSAMDREGVSSRFELEDGH